MKLTSKLYDAIEKNDSMSASEAFKSAMYDKLGTLLNNKRVEISNKLFKTYTKGK